MKTVWFTRGHSLRNALLLIRREGAGRLRLIVSHPYEDAPALTAADVALVEPRGLSAADYADWCVATCREHRVDLLVPAEHREAVAAAADRLAAIGTRVALAAPPPVLALIEDKGRLAAEAARHAIPVPRTVEVTTGADLHAVVADLAAAGLDACVKPPVGVFGAGFWRLSDDLPLIARLMDPDGRTLPTATVAAALDEAPGSRLLVMEHLPGTETSVDILAHHGRVLAAVSRAKGRVSQRIATTGMAIDLATRVVATFGLHGLVNVQTIEDAAGTPRLLEINPRMSGACLHTLFAGIALPWWWIAIELGLADPADVPVPRGTAVVAAIPDAIRLDDPAGPTMADLVRGRLPLAHPLG
jgi:biotin carboxylase